MPRVEQQERRFFDGGRPATGDAPAEPPHPEQPPRIVLSRAHDLPVDRFRMDRRLGYRDRELGDILVPADPESFVTDLTSVPTVFTWLVPKDGAHLPAALLHDGLSYSACDVPSYVSVEGHRIDAVEADRVFRDAMADTGTGCVRRWLMWTAVTMATLFTGRGTALPRAVLWWHRGAVAGTVLVVVLLGLAATVDLLDLDWPVPGVPWMPEADLGQELAQGLAGAVVVPFLLAASWGRFWVAGVITGLALALLLHVTIAVVAVTLVYRAAEILVGRAPRVSLGLAAVVLTCAGVLFLAALMDLV